MSITHRANSLPGDLIAFQMPLRGGRGLLAICVSVPSSDGVQPRCIVSEATQRGYRTRTVISNGAGKLIWDVTARLIPLPGILYHTGVQPVGDPRVILLILSHCQSVSARGSVQACLVTRVHRSISCQTSFREILGLVLLSTIQEVRFCGRRS